MKHPFRTHPRRALTLVELLVTISVVAIVIAMILPSLRGARIAAETSICDARMRTLSQVTEVYCQRSRDRWPNALPPGPEYAIFELGTTYVIGNPLSQTPLWIGILQNEGVVNVWDHGDSRGLSCPAIWRWMEDILIETNPQAGPQKSYWYSAAFVTDPRFWDPGDPRIRTGANQHRRALAAGDVLFPSAKAVFFELSDAHRSGMFTGDPATSSDARPGAAFADGHVGRARLGSVAPAIPTSWPEPDIFFYFERTPYASTPYGVRGRDLAN